MSYYSIFVTSVIKSCEQIEKAFQVAKLSGSRYCTFKSRI